MRKSEYNIVENIEINQRKERRQHESKELK